MKNIHLDSKILVTPDCHLVMVKEARLDGEEVVGVFGSEPQRITNPISLCESFLNCRSDQDILRFTKRYGPLFEQYANVSPETLPFRFSLYDWFGFQYDLKSLWGTKAAVEQRFGRGFHFRVGKALDSSPVDEAFVLSPKGNRFVFADLSRLVYFYVHVLPAERMRICSRPDCGKFFYANHLKQTYCGSLECAHWGQLQSKKACWSRNKEKYLAQR